MNGQPPSARFNAVWFSLILIIVLFLAWLTFQDLGDDIHSDTPIPTEPAQPEASATLPPVYESKEVEPTSPPSSYPLPTEPPVPSPYPAPAEPYPMPTSAPPTAYPAPEGG